MPQDGTEHRKLAAIMFTDMVGYSTLVERNEALALELLEEHQRLLRKRTYVQPTYLGFVHASLGNHDEAFACFTRGLEHENGSLAWFREYCIFAGLDRLRADSRFPALLEKIGLEPKGDQRPGKFLKSLQHRADSPFSPQTSSAAARIS